MCIRDRRRVHGIKMNSLNNIEGNFHCQHKGCNRSYQSKFSLKRHLLSHMNERKHKCPHCNKGFALAQYLREHIHTHTGEKPFACTFPGCGKRFRQAGKLSMHKKDHNQAASNKTKSEISHGEDDGFTNLRLAREVFIQLNNFNLPEMFFTRKLPLPAIMMQNKEIVMQLEQDLSLIHI
eukprot:TRINITY_DN1321_c0_g1_i1.p1 TRINITY_DN1321_c0_g1~~TRINITY_DN1321_c0_g1_i1.p1  ORF type:complete len:191 (-),score=50.39 TRINITY_DN1321_c0_g1_i1:35-571(-)